MLARLRHADISRAVAKLNEAAGLTYSAIGYHLYQDVRGEGIYRPRIYRIINEGGGVTYSPLNGRTMRETLAKVTAATGSN